MSSSKKLYWNWNPLLIWFPLSRNQKWARQGTQNIQDNNKYVKVFFSQKVHLLDQSKRARLFSKSKYEHKKQGAIVFGNEQASNACAFTWFFSISSTSKQRGKSEALEGRSLRHLYSKRPLILWAERELGK